MISFDMHARTLKKRWHALTSYLTTAGDPEPMHWVKVLAKFSTPDQERVVPAANSTAPASQILGPSSIDK